MLCTFFDTKLTPISWTTMGHDAMQHVALHAPEKIGSWPQGLRTIDYASLREYSISKLLCFELTSTSFFLTKDGYLQKTAKSELMREIEKGIETSPNNCKDDTMIAIDYFMAYARKNLVNKLRLTLFGDFAQNLWSTFNYICRDSKRIDKIFDVYKDDIA